MLILDRPIKYSQTPVLQHFSPVWMAGKRLVATSSHTILPPAYCYAKGEAKKESRRSSTLLMSQSVRLPMSSPLAVSRTPRSSELSHSVAHHIPSTSARSRPLSPLVLSIFRSPRSVVRSSSNNLNTHFTTSRYNDKTLKCTGSSSAAVPYDYKITILWIL